MRVFPDVASTAPRLPLEKSYDFFIRSSLLWVGFSHIYVNNGRWQRFATFGHLAQSLKSCGSPAGRLLSLESASAPRGRRRVQGATQEVVGLPEQASCQDS